MIKGTYGRVVDGVVEAMTSRSGPFKLSAKREAELVAAGVAVKVQDPACDYEGMKMTELRELAEERGVDVTGARRKQDIIDALEAAEAGEA
jgi:hypothetical protein